MYLNTSNKSIHEDFSSCFINWFCFIYLFGFIKKKCLRMYIQYTIYIYMYICISTVYKLNFTEGRGAWRQRSADRFVLLARARPDKNTVRGSDDIKPSLNYGSSLCISFFVRERILSCQHRDHGQFSRPFLAFVFVFRNSRYLRFLLPLLPAGWLWRNMPSEKTFKQRRTFGRC